MAMVWRKVQSQSYGGGGLAGRSLGVGGKEEGGYKRGGYRSGIRVKKGKERKLKQHTPIPKLGLKAAPIPCGLPNLNCAFTATRLSVILPPTPTQAGYKVAISNGLLGALQFVS